MMADSYDTLIALSSQGAKVPPEILIELAPVQASVKRKLLAILSKPDPAAQAAQQVEMQAAQAKVAESQSKAQLNVAKAQETAQGGAHGIVERQMDAQMAGQEHQMKMQELGAKAQSERMKGTMDLRGEFARLEADRVKTAQSLGADVMKSSLQLRHAEEMHRQKMRHAAQAPKKGSNGSA
jgi:hypothetical protein